MKRYLILFIGLFFVFTVNAQINADGTGFKMEFDFENGPAPDVMNYEGVTISYNLPPSYEGEFKINNGELEWYVMTESIFTIDFDTPLDLSGNSELQFKYSNWNNSLEIFFHDVNDIQGVILPGHLGLMIEGDPNWNAVQNSSILLEDFVNGYDVSDPLTTEPGTVDISAVSTVTFYSESENVTWYLDDIFIGNVTDVVLDVTNISCIGKNDGSIDLSIYFGTAPYTFLWSNDSTTEDLFNLEPGEYTVTVTDADNETRIDSGIISEPEKLELNLLEKNICSSEEMGSIEAKVKGGTPPYNFIWSNDDTTKTIYDLDTGNYILTVTDYNGCSTTDSTMIVEYDSPINVQINYPGGAICDSMVLDAGEGYSYYYWSTGDTSQEIVIHELGSFRVDVFNEFNCSASDEITIEGKIEPFQDEEICLITVDSESDNNMIVWEKTADVNTTMFNIYRETNILGEYDQIGSTLFEEPGIYIDMNSDPSIQSYSYKIAVIDSCGHVSDLSRRHATMHLTMNVGINGETNLIWSRYKGIIISTYNIWRAAELDSLEIIGSVSGSNFSFSDKVPLEGTNIYMVEAVSQDSCNPNNLKSTYESSFSNKVTRLPEGIYNSSESQQIKIYPNPVRESTIISYPNQNRESYSMVISDLSGKIVYDLPYIVDDSFELSRGQLSSGLYIIQLRGSNIYRGIIVIE